MRGLKLLCSAAALVALLAPGATADEWNKKTYLTFSGPVQIPGATLAAGTYTFEIANPDTNRHVIRVSEKDTNKHIGLFLTIPNERMEPPDDNLIMFSERPAGQPQAIQAWFYPGNRIGEEFVYPKAQAIQIAKATKKGVLATEGGGVTTASEEARMASLRGATVGRVDESGRMTNEESKPATTTARAATTTAPESTTASRAATAPSTTARAATAPSTTANRGVGTAGAQDNAASERRRSLPRTASNLYTFEALSGLSLLGALAVRRFRLAKAV
jgi:hypothetical protein